MNDLTLSESLCSSVIESLVSTSVLINCVLVIGTSSDFCTYTIFIDDSSGMIDVNVIGLSL